MEERLREELMREATETGFTRAGELNIGALEFMPEVRAMCNAKSCNRYGTNWRCPPACGTIEEAAEQAAQYSAGIVVQTVGVLEDEFDYETMFATGTTHKQNFSVLIEKVRRRVPDMLPMGAGACEICKVCTYPDAPCRYPDKAVSSMEAYGLWVSRVCELSGVPYNDGKGTITYTSCYLVK